MQQYDGLTRREFLKSSAGALVAGAVAGVLRPINLFAATSPWETDGYNHKVVVRVYDNSVASTYTFGDQYYWRKFDLARMQQMLETGIMRLSSTITVADAWTKILPGVFSDSKVVVKVNFNNTGRDYKTTALNVDPYMMIALTKSLNIAGIQNANITFIDCSRSFPTDMKNDVLARCAGVNCLSGVQPASSTSIAMPYGNYMIPQIVMNANYLISLHLMKKHDNGITGCMKNLFGMKADGNVGAIAHGKPDWATGNQIKNIIMNTEIKNRLKLCINDAILAAKSPDTLDAYGYQDIFPKGKPSSIILSRNPFYQDIVNLDFVNAECRNDTGCRSSADDSVTWLHNCAGAMSNWVDSLIKSGIVVNGAAGLPPKDLSYNASILEYISTTANLPRKQPALPAMR